MGISSGVQPPWTGMGGRGRNLGQHYEVGLNVQVNSFFFFFSFSSPSDYKEQILTKDFQPERRNCRVWFVIEGAQMLLYIKK